MASTDDTLYVPVEALMTIGDATYLMVENGDGQTAAMPDFGGMTLPDHADFGVMTPPDGAPADATGDTAETSDSGETAQRRGVATLRRSRPNRRAATCSPKPSRR